MIIQRFSEEWGEYIDIENDVEIPERGKLEVVLVENLSALFDGGNSKEWVGLRLYKCKG